MDFDASQRLAKALIAAYNDDADPETVADMVHDIRPLSEGFNLWRQAISARAEALDVASHAIRTSGAKAEIR